MKLIHQFISAVVLLPLVGGSAAASEQEDQWYVSGLATYISPDSSRNLQQGIAGGQFNFGRAFTEHLNFELEYDLLDLDGDSGKPDTELNALGVNGLYVFDRAGSFSPYVLAGIGALKSDPSGSSSSTDFQAQVGPGFLWDLWEDRLSLRTEAIGRWADNDRDFLVNAGLQYAFGGAAAAPVAAGPFDTDGDGVYDDKDQCPNTPPNTVVDKVGCAVPPVDNDTDNDGVANDIDECPDSPARSLVNDVGCRYQVLGVLFAFDSAELTSDDIRDLNEAAAVLDRKKALNITVEGYTDSRGDADYNMGLSKRRADSVKAYLVSRGVAAGRISTVGKGESDPVASNDTDEGRAANRRCELRVDEP